MITIIRRNQKVLMLIVAVLTIIAFAWLYNPAIPDELGANVAARVYGRTFTPADIERLSRTYGLSIQLGELDIVRGLSGMARSEEEAGSEFVTNLIVLRHEAALMGIEPTPTEILARIRSIQAFQTSGQFDPAKLEVFVRDRLGPRGMTVAAIEEMAADAIRYDRVHAAVGSPASVAPVELARARRIFQSADVSVVRFPLTPLLATIPVAEADVQSYFERNKAMFVAPERLTIEYAVFAPDEAAKKLEGKDRVLALQKTAGQASAFAESAPADAFAASASAVGAKVQTSQAFDRQAAMGGAGGIPPAVAQHAFLLTGERPVSDVIQAGDDFYVFRIVNREAERPLTFEEARPEAETRLKRAAAERVLQENAVRAIAAIREGLVAGKPLQEAAIAAGVTLENFQGVVPSDPSKLPPDLMVAAQVSRLLEPGQISNFVPTGDGGVAVAVTSRGTETGEAAVGIEADLLEGKRELLFASWLGSQRQAANFQFPRNPAR